MSNWKDTVMGEGEVWALMDGHYQGDEILKVGVRVAKAQAKISFKLRTEDILKQLNGFNERGLTLTEAIALLK